MKPTEFFKQLFEVGAIKIDTREGCGFSMRIHDTHPNAPLSPIYVNLRTPENPKPGPLTPELVAEIGKILWDVASESELGFDGICGIPNAGTPLVRAFYDAAWGAGHSYSILTLQKELCAGVPVFTGVYDNDGLDAINLEESRNNSILLIDDVITYGGTKDGAVRALVDEGYDVNTILVLCDRQQGGVEGLRKKRGIAVESAFTLSNIVDMLRSIKAISPDDAKIVLEYLEQTRVS